jgi:hypothetical protein
MQIGSRDLPSANHYAAIFDAYTPRLNISFRPWTHDREGQGDEKEIGRKDDKEDEREKEEMELEERQ